jgi:hypothetical protein
VWHKALSSNSSTEREREEERRREGSRGEGKGKKRRGGEREPESIVKEKLAEKFLSQRKVSNQDWKHRDLRSNTIQKRSSSRHIIIKLSKIKDSTCSVAHICNPS